MNRRKGVIYLAVMLFLGWSLGIVGWADVSERPPTTNTAGANWTNPADAYSSNNLYATSTTNNALWTYGGYGFVIPALSTITNVEVGGEYYTTAADDIIGIDVSWDGGTLWSPAQNLTVKTSDNNVVQWLDFTSAPSPATWDITKLNDTNFRVRVKCIRGSNPVSVSLDYLPARVTYTPPVVTTTVGNGTDPGSATIAPGATNQPLDAFTLQTSSGTDAVTAIRVTTANTTAVNTVYIKSDDGLTTYGSSSSPAVDNWDISVTGLTATTTLTQYKVYLDAKGHASLPAAVSYAVTGTVTLITSGNTKSYNDSGSATVTVDNAPPANATWGTITPAISQITLNWTNPTDSDFSAVLILRNTVSITDGPTDGNTYSAPGTIGASAVVYVGSGTSFIDTPLTNGQPYYYKIFAYDTRLNYAAGVQTGPHTPGNQPPTASSSNITGADDPVYAGVQYQVTAVYSDTDGASDLNELHFALNHDIAIDIIFNTVQGAAATGIATVTSGAAYLIGNVTYSKTEGSPTVNDVTVTWTFTLAWGWTESLLIEYGVRATDDAANSSAWSYTALGVLYENDLTLSGTLAASGAIQGPLTSGVSWVKGSETLSWSGLTVVYQGSAISPADADFDIQITNDNPLSWTQTTGAALGLNTTADAATDISDIHTVTVINIPVGGSYVSSANDTFTIKVDATAPDQVTGPSVDTPATTGTSIKLNWTAILDDAQSGFKEYTVYYDVDTGIVRADYASQWTKANDAALGTRTTATTTITGLNPGTQYFFRVGAKDNTGNENLLSLEVTGTTLAWGGDGYLLRRTNNNDNTCGGPGKGCHDVQVHNSTNTASTKWPSGWGITGGRGGEFNCRTCHTPHSTRNIFVIKESLNFSDITGGLDRTIDFRCRSSSEAACGGSPTYAMGNDLGGHTTSTRVCEACHSATNYHRYDTTGQAKLDHNNGADCTGCHLHNVGFKKPVSSESSGNQACTCHNTNLFTPMSGTSNYHHFMNNNQVTTLVSGSKYPRLDQPATPGDQTDANRRCLMCHVDHDIFRPDLNANNTIGRSANLRTDISTLPTTTSAYTNTDFVNSGTGGICLSCHNTAQTKSYTQPDGTSQTPKIPYEDTLADQVAAFNASAHQYTVPGTIATDSSPFQANCSKCHIGIQGEGAENKFNPAGPQFGLHDSTLRRLLAVLGISTPADPLEENFCYRCHSQATDTTPGGGPAKSLAGYDYWGVRAMVTNAELLYRDINTAIGTVASGSTATVINVSGTTGWAANQWANYFLEITSGALAGQSRRISSNTTTSITVSLGFSAAPAASVTYQIGSVHDVEAYSGIHKIVEGAASGWNTGATRHVECEDCHNPHAVAAGLTRTSGTVASATASTLTANGTPNWPANRWKDYLVNITTTGRGQARYIASNTTNSLTIVGNWATNPSANDAFTLVSAVWTNGGMATGGNTTSLADTSRAWTTDQWVGYYVQTVSGTGAGQVRQIIANSSTSLTVNPSWTAPASGTGYLIYQTPLIADANWGIINVVEPNITTDGTMRSTTYASKSTIIAQYDLCLKCHSTWAYDLETSAPNVPSNYPSAYDTFNANTVQQTDIGKDFDLDNYAYHPLFAPGKNQPLRMGNAGSPSWAPNISYNANWPYVATGGANAGTAGGTVTATAGSTVITGSGTTFPAGAGAGWWIWINTLGTATGAPTNPTTSGMGGGGRGWWPVAARNSTTSLTLAVPFSGTSGGSSSFYLTKGLKSNFVDGWGPEGLVTCTDCHNTSSATTARGPHGAANRWFLRNQEAQTITDGAGAVTTTTVTNPLNVCLNCHSVNVYGDVPPGGGTLAGAGNNTYGRMSHPVNNANYGIGSSMSGFYQIPCMNCHSGVTSPGTPGPGQLHGSDLGVGANPNSTSLRGFRFMNGATWNGHTTNQTAGGSSTCYNIETVNSLANCTKHTGTGVNVAHNYTY